MHFRVALNTVLSTTLSRTNLSWVRDGLGSLDRVAKIKVESCDLLNPKTEFER